MKRLSVLFLAIILSGCATTTLTVTCPATSTGVSFAIAGSTIGNTLLSMLGGALTKGGLMAPLNAPAAPTPTGGTMKYTYVPIFGADSGSLTCTSPQATPGVLVPGPPPAILH